MLSLIQIFHVDVSAYVSMRMGLPDYATSESLKKFVLEYFRVLKNLKRAVKSRPT